MRAYVGVTDGDWVARLRSLPDLDEVNFWLPSPDVGFAALKPGEPFLFKTHFPENRLVGGGFFEGFVPLRVSEAWSFFGEGNGVQDQSEFVRRIAKYRAGRRVDASELEQALASSDPNIGCVMLRDVVWFGDDSLPAPESWAKNIVRGKGYEQGDDEIVDLAIMRLLGEGTERVESQLEAVTSLGPTRGQPILTIPRINQGAFRAVVLHAYDSRCAITGHRIRPTLQAAHIRPVSHGGEHRVDNGLLLRSDVHTLFDLGYVTVDPDLRVRVSPRLEKEFGNGRELYDLEAKGALIHVPKSATSWPSKDFLEWHQQQLFLAS